MPAGTFGLVAGGFEHTCALLGSGAAYCWGENLDGELGDGTTTARSSPVLVAAGGLRFGAVRPGWYHACGIASGSAAFCWGYNGHGQLGEGSTAASVTPVPVVQ